MTDPAVATGNFTSAPATKSISSPHNTPYNTVRVWQVPFARWTLSRTLDEIESLIKKGQAAYFMTVNLHTTMLINNCARMRRAVAAAAFVVADGMPLVWASRLRPRRLPERVAGADLVPAICERAAQKGYRIFFLGGKPGVGEEAAANLISQFPGLQVVGIESPPFRPTTPAEEAELLERIRATRPHLLFVAFGQPKGELWVHQNSPTLTETVCVQVGGTLDFVAGRIRRAPQWMRRLGLEWAYRLSRDPRRLFARYARNALFLGQMSIAELFSCLQRRSQSGCHSWEKTKISSDCLTRSQKPR